MMSEGRPTPQQPFVVDARIRQMIAGAVAEVDLAQIAMLRKLTVAERFVMATAMISGAERVAAYRLRQHTSGLTEDEAVRAVRRRGLVLRAQVEEAWRNHR